MLLDPTEAEGVAESLLCDFLVAASSSTIVTNMSEKVLPKTVLIVEDHPDMRELLVWQIQLMGYKPVEASHAKEGLEKAVIEKPALILLDIMMP